MSWILLNRTHVNMENITVFRWQKEHLVIFMADDGEPAEFKDPDKTLYFKLCDALGVAPCE